MLGHEAVTLNWRLFWRSLRQSSGSVWVAGAAALLAASTMGESALRLGESLISNEIPRNQTALLVNMWLWSTFVAGFAYALAAGELSFIRSLLADLALRPISRWRAFLAVQAISTAGPHALALLSVGLPWLIVMATWLDGRPLAAGVAATFVMMRLPLPLLLIGSRFLSASLATAAASAGAVAVTIGVVWLTTPDTLITWSPPGLVAGILLDDSARSGWLGLAVWTLVVAAIEMGSMRLDAAPRSSPAKSAPAGVPMPAAVAAIAKLGRCHAALLHGELLRLARWRRYQLTWFTCVLIFALLGTRLDGRAGLVPLAIFSLAPVQMGGSVLANLFATDRGGFHALLMAPAGLAAVLRAKVIAVVLFVMTGQLAAAAFLLTRGIAWPVVAAGVLLALGLFMWATAIGLVTSVLFPSASDPQTVGGALVNTPAFVAVAIGSSLYIGATLGLAYVLESGRWSLPATSFAGVALVGGAASALNAALRLSPRLITVRQEAMLSALMTTGIPR